MEFNKEQQVAIDTIDKNVCVVAGAGTGKTQILTHRFINIIKSSANPKDTMTSILAITFTKKATKEMIERIGKEIAKLSEEDKRYEDLVNHLSFLNISTIDSFCKNVIDENSFIIGLPSDHEVVDELEGDKILDEVISEVIDDYIENEVLIDYLIQNRYFRTNDFIKEIKGAYKKITQKGYSYNDLLSKFPKEEIEKEEYLIFVEEIESACNLLLENKFVTSRSGFVKEMNKGLFDDLREMDELELVEEKLKIIKNGVEIAKNIPIDTKEQIYSLINSYLANYEYEYYKYYKLINEILLLVDERFRKSKLQSGKLQFSDLVYFTREILKNNEILNLYKEKFQYIMIDEYQDTNLTQRDIFYQLASTEKLLGRNNLFVVGDPKQSIYGFRGSEMSVFETTLEDMRNSDGVIVELAENYRSSKELVNYSNELFSIIMEDKYNSLKSNPDIAKVLEKKVKYYDISSSETKEAEVIAREIIRLQEEGKKFKDIAILFRSSTHLKALEEELNKYRIPFINPKSKEFYYKREIKDIILFLHVLNSEEDSQSLYGLLRSNFFLISDDELYRLSKIDGDNLFSKLMNYEGDNEKIKFAKKTLRSMSSIRNQTSIFEILSQFIEVTKYYETLALISNSQQRIENIRKFQEITLNFSKNESIYINEFLDYIVLQSTVDTEEALVEGDSDSINLMTIHGSKGLEFPVVIFYDSKNTGNIRSSKIEVNRNLGYGISMNGSYLFEHVKGANKLEDKEERNRLLYVCVTRAKEEFIFIKTTEKNTGFIEKLFLPMDYEFNMMEEIPEIKDAILNEMSISTDESLVGSTFTFPIKKKRVTSSITGYNTFIRCKREFYLKYKIGIKGIDIKEEKFHEENNYDYYSLGIDAAEYGTMVHSLIENYDLNMDLDIQINNLLMEKNQVDNISAKEAMYKHMNNYLKRKIDGDKYLEFDFLYELENGNIVGSIDQVICIDDEIEIMDFKTNRVRYLDNLVERYKPQLRIYSLVIEEIFGIPPKLALIHFLDSGDIVEIPWDENENKKLLSELNIFLRFVSDFDNIYKYECSEKCHEYCDFLEFCN